MGQRKIFCNKCGAGFMIDEAMSSLFCTKCGNKIIVPKPKNASGSVTESASATAMYNCVGCGAQNVKPQEATIAKCVSCGMINRFNPVPGTSQGSDGSVLKPVLCPSCGARLNITSLTEPVKCDFCGTCFMPDTSFLINRENAQTAERIRYMELEADRINRMNQERLAREQLEHEKKKLKINTALGIMKFLKP